MTRSPASGNDGALFAFAVRFSPSDAKTCSLCWPIAGGGVCGPTRLPLNSKYPEAIWATTPGASSIDWNVPRESKCSFERAREASYTGVQTMPRSCALAETSSTERSAKSSSYKGLRIASAMANRPGKDSYSSSCRYSGSPSHARISRHCGGLRTINRT